CIRDQPFSLPRLGWIPPSFVGHTDKSTFSAGLIPSGLYITPVTLILVSADSYSGRVSTGFKSLPPYSKTASQPSQTPTSWSRSGCAHEALARRNTHATSEQNNCLQFITGLVGE